MVWSSPCQNTTIPWILNWYAFHAKLTELEILSVLHQLPVTSNFQTYGDSSISIQSPLSIHFQEETDCQSKNPICTYHLQLHQFEYIESCSQSSSALMSLLRDRKVHIKQPDLLLNVPEQPKQNVKFCWKDPNLSYH